MKKCEHCGELIPIQADICRYCKKPVKRGTPATRMGNVLQIIAAIILALVFFYALLANFYYSALTGDATFAIYLRDLIGQPVEIASKSGNYLPMIIEYGGAMLAISLYGVGWFLKARAEMQ
jgi:hypothetical protein